MSQDEFEAQRKRLLDMEAGTATQSSGLMTDYFDSLRQAGVTPGIHLAFSGGEGVFNHDCGDQRYRRMLSGLHTIYHTLSSLRHCDCVDRLVVEHKYLPGRDFTLSTLLEATTRAHSKIRSFGASHPGDDFIGERGRVPFPDRSKSTSEQLQCMSIDFGNSRTLSMPYKPLIIILEELVEAAATSVTYVQIHLPYEPG